MTKQWLRKRGGARRGILVKHQRPIRNGYPYKHKPKAAGWIRSAA